MICNKKVSEELIVAISQYKTVNYTIDSLISLSNEGIPYTSLVLFDGTPITEIGFLDGLAGISIKLKSGVHSLPEIWNMLFGMAKLTRAKYLYWAGSDMLLKQGGLESMMDIMLNNPDVDIVSPVKIDEDREKFDNYKPVFDAPKEIIGFNDSAALFRLSKMPFFPFEYEYAPYQFETTALAYKFHTEGCKSILDPNAVIFHYCSKDIEHSPEERKLGSETWDQKLEIFREKNKHGYNMQWFVDNVIMNSNNANKYGFPCWIEGKKFQPMESSLTRNAKANLNINMGIEKRLNALKEFQ